MPDALAKTFHGLVKFFEGSGLWWGVAISVGLAVGSLALAIAIVTNWSVDHFKETGRAGLWEHRHPIVRVLGIIAKNLAGVVLLVIGAIMALPGVPGQGFLTMIIGVTLLDFPGKRRLERRLIARPWVLRNINRLRARFNRPALEL